MSEPTFTSSSGRDARKKRKVQSINEEQPISNGRSVHPIFEKGSTTEQLNSLSLSDPVLCLMASADPPAIPVSPSSCHLLEAMVHPLSPQDFLGKCFRKKALHVSCGAERVQELVDEYMFGLDVLSILRETSSESVFVWLKSPTHKKRSGGRGDTNPEEEPPLIRSVEISDPETAHALHSTAGHATYCRAPAELEQPLVSSMLRDTGLGCGQYDPSGERTVSLGRGEVEVFVGTEGHCTGWHTDFQENFTLQLSGKKKWILRQGTVRYPLRGCTPHYAAPDAVEGQLKAARLSNPNFHFGKQDLDTNAFGDERTLVLEAGHMLYFPAGMWHRVETVEPGVSINISLMATNYATLVCQALQHILLKEDRWRETVVNGTGVRAACPSSTGAHTARGDGLPSATEKLDDLLTELPSIVQKFASEGGAQSILPPVLRHPPSFRSDRDNEEIDESEVVDEEEFSDGEGAVVEDGKGESSSEEVDDVIDVDTFEGPNGWTVEESGANSNLVKNPLATLTRMNDINKYYTHSGNSVGVSNDGECQTSLKGDLFVLNVSYAGNEMHESAIRVVLRDACKSNNALEVCAECEMKGVDPATHFGAKHEAAEHDNLSGGLQVPKCLFFYGYFHWVDRKN